MTSGQPKIVLYAFEKHAGIPPASGFCQKLECYFRFAEVVYEEQDALPHQAPKKKLPYVTVDGRVIADSQFIVRHLKSNDIADLDKAAGLTPAQVAESVAYRGYWEEGIYPAIVRCRWFQKENEPVVAQEVFGDLPLLIRVPLRWWFRRNIKTALTYHGVGRHTDEEANVIMREAIESLAVRLGQSAANGKSVWFHGTEKPTDIDATIGAFLMNLVGTESNPYPKTMVLKHAVLREYMKVVIKGYFPEFTKLLDEVFEADKTFTATVLPEIQQQ